jgi:hypothetical protein
MNFEMMQFFVRVDARNSTVFVIISAPPIVERVSSTFLSSTSVPLARITAEKCEDSSP